MMDKVHIRCLDVDAYIGIYESEKNQSQPLSLDVTFSCDFSRVFASGELADTLDYDAIQQHIRGFFQQHRFGLLETLAITLMQDLFLAFALISHIHMIIRKPQAIAPALAVIECERGRNDLEIASHGDSVSILGL